MNRRIVLGSVVCYYAACNVVEISHNLLVAIYGLGADHTVSQQRDHVTLCFE